MPHAVAMFLTASSGVVAKPGHTVTILPWAGHKSATGFDARTQESALLGGGRIASNAPAQNNYIEWDIWLDTGTYKYAQAHYRASDTGIYSVRLGGVEQGAIDGYNAVDSTNTYSEVAGIAVTAGLYAFRLQIATKHASSSGYQARLQSCAWIRTA